MSNSFTYQCLRIGIFTQLCACFARLHILMDLICEAQIINRIVLQSIQIGRCKHSNNQVWAVYNCIIKKKKIGSRYL